MSKESELLEAQVQTALDASGAQNLQAKRVVMVTERDDQATRVAKLGAYFREFIGTWIDQIEGGVRMTEELYDELATSLVEYASMVLYAPGDASGPEPTEVDAQKCIAAAHAAAHEAVDLIRLRPAGVDGPSWLRDAAEALRGKNPDGSVPALNWTQVIHEIRHLRERHTKLQAATSGRICEACGKLIELGCRTFDADGLSFHDTCLRDAES